MVYNVRQQMAKNLFLMTEYSEIGMEARRSHILKLRMSDPRFQVGLLHKKALYRTLRMSLLA